MKDLWVEEAPVLPVGCDPRPEGDNWRLVEYDWRETDGIGRFLYRRRGGGRHLIDLEQPAGPHHASWPHRPVIDHDAVKARYFEYLDQSL